MSIRLTLIALTVLVAAGRASLARPQLPLWPLVEDRVVDELCERDVGKWASELGRERLTDDFEDLLLRFDVYLRAGHIEALREVIERMPLVEASGYNAINQRGYGEYNWLATRLIDNRRFELAQQLLQSRPQTRCLAVKRLLDHLIDTKQVERANRFVHIYEKHYPNYFVELRHHIYTRAGGKPNLLAELTKQVQRPQQLRRRQAIIAEDRPQDLKLPSTWIAQAEYFARCMLIGKAEGAFKQALELAPVANEHTSRSPNRRADVIRHYSYFLAKYRGVNPMMKFLIHELDHAELGSNYQLYVVQEMVTHTRDGDDGMLEPNDERLWAFLDARRDWSMISQALLVRMADNAEGDMILSQRFWKRAESLAAGNLARAETLGRVMVEKGQFMRSVPILEAAERVRTADGMRTQASLTLLHAYVALGQWESADVTWKRAVRSIHRDNVPMLLGQVSAAAAKAGERDEAMQWWRRRTNFNRDYFRDIDKMLATGMREELLDFYRTLAKDDPSSDSPRHVVECISQHFSDERADANVTANRAEETDTADSHEQTEAEQQDNQPFVVEELAITCQPKVRTIEIPIYASMNNAIPYPIRPAPMLLKKYCLAELFLDDGNHKVSILLSDVARWKKLLDPQKDHEFVIGDLRAKSNSTVRSGYLKAVRLDGHVIYENRSFEEMEEPVSGQQPN